MTNLQILKKVEKLIQLEGPAKAAAIFDLRDQRTVKRWVEKKTLPQARKAFIEDKLKNYLKS